MSKYTTDLPLAQLDSQGLTTVDGWLTVYCINQATREYQGVAQEYLPVGVGLPAGSYVDKPTLPTDELALVRSVDGSEWQVLPDFRGQTAYYKGSRAEVVIEAVGELPATLTLLPPGSEYDVWNGKAWVKDDAAEQAAAQGQAEQQKSRLMQQADAKIAPLEKAVRLGIATEKEQAALTAWETYSVLLSRVDVAKAPDIKWPQIPTEL